MDFISYVKIIFDSNVDQASSNFNKAENSALQYLMTTQAISSVMGTLSPVIDALNSSLVESHKQYAMLEQAVARTSSVITDSNAINGSLEYSMNAIKSAAEDWGSGFVQGAKIASIGADEFANAAYNAISAGLNVSDAISATQSAAIVAKATMGSTSGALDLITDAYTNLGGSITHIGDVIAKTQGQYKFANLEQLRSGFAETASDASAMGVSIEEIAVSLGILNTAGKKGSSAGTAYKNMLLQMKNASKKLGFEIMVDDITGALNLEGTLKNIKAKTDMMQEFEKGSALSEAFGSEASPVVNAIISDLDGYTSAIKDMKLASGDASSMASRMSNNYNDFATRLENSRNTIAGFFGSGQKDIKMFFGQAEMGFLRFSYDLQQISPSINAFIGGVGFMAGGMFDFGMSALNITSQIGMALPVLKSLNLASKAQAVTNFFLSGSFATLAMASLPYIAIAGAIALGAVIIVRNWERIGACFYFLWEKIKPVLMIIADGISWALLWPIRIWSVLFPEQWDAMWATLKKGWDAFSGWLVNAWQKIAELWNKFKNWLGFGDDSTNVLNFETNATEEVSAISSITQKQKIVPYKETNIPSSISQGSKKQSAFSYTVAGGFGNAIITNNSSTGVPDFAIDGTASTSSIAKPESMIDVIVNIRDEIIAMREEMKSRKVNSIHIGDITLNVDDDEMDFLRSIARKAIA